MIVLFFGPPGCGKGTQASFISRSYRIPAISTGELFRAECRAGTPLGKHSCSIMAQGGLVGDEIVNQMVVNRIGKPDCLAGFLLDGYPRTKPQAEFFDGVLSEKGLPKPMVIHLEVRAETLVHRISTRRQCPTCLKIYNVGSQAPKSPGICDEDGAALIVRQDDTEAVIHQRLIAYEEITGPVITHYRGSGYHRVNGDRSPQEVLREITRLLAPSPRWARRPREIPALDGRSISMA
ncbi:MAG TPA: nucleoside monophosphate kinase [Bryobacteraceae bacterium]|nr:nucleoside monophosphate kinase [Bryobacteraceae bacterium]